MDGYLFSVARHTDTSLETDVGPQNAINDKDEDGFAKSCRDLRHKASEGRTQGSGRGHTTYNT